MADKLLDDNTWAAIRERIEEQIAAGPGTPEAARLDELLAALDTCFGWRRWIRVSAGGTE